MRVLQCFRAFVFRTEGLKAEIDSSVYPVPVLGATLPNLFSTKLERLERAFFELGGQLDGQLDGQLGGQLLKNI